MNMLGVPKYTVNKVHEKIYSISVQRERERERAWGGWVHGWEQGGWTAAKREISRIARRGKGVCILQQAMQ
jgi:hypothetical protein